MLTVNENVYPNLNKIEAGGFIPIWVQQYEEVYDIIEMSLKEYLDKTYQFGLHEMGGEVLEDGTYRYPGDDDLPWILRMDTPDGTMYQYMYGIVAIPTEDGYFVTRMD